MINITCVSTKCKCTAVQQKSVLVYYAQAKVSENLKKKKKKNSREWPSRFGETFYIHKKFLENLIHTKNKSFHIRPSKFFVYFTRRNLLFLFYTITFIKHPHQFIYFTRIFNKIFILLNFFIISLHSLYLYNARSLSLFRTDHLSLSLSLSLSQKPSSGDP